MILKNQGYKRKCKEGWKRTGYNPAIVERVRCGEYPQFFWDWIPIID
jgi:hypothetical protein